MWKRLKKWQDWLHALCLELFRERSVELVAGRGFQVRAIDATTVKEPGKPGSLWRIHCSVWLPSLAYDFFKLTETEGPVTGEPLQQFPVREGDYLLAYQPFDLLDKVSELESAGAVQSCPARVVAPRGYR